jgi:hypothetical protein
VAETRKQVILLTPSQTIQSGCRAQDEKKTLLKVGLFINKQFPEGCNLVERVPKMVAAAARRWIRLLGG